ncbi:FkbM family methyltransferase [bacterium]|nr:FkbM family methyltransferase [bacterium]
MEFCFYPLLEAQKVGPRGRVYALEPVSRSFALLQKNITNNKKQKIIFPYRLALAPQDGIGIMCIKDRHNASFLSGYSQTEKREGVSKEKVRTVTLDSFLRNKPLPHLLRLDTEGMEAKVFLGGKKVLRAIPEIMVEIHPHLIPKKQFLAMCSFLQRYGFYPEAIIVDPYPCWITPDKKWKRLALLFSYLCGDRNKFGIFKGSWSSFKKAYFLKNISFCVYFVKK